MRARGLLAGLLAGALVFAGVTDATAATVETVREATWTNVAGIQATVNAFRADMGDPNNGNTVGPLPTGRREITWDVSDGDSAPARLPGDFFNAVAPRGAVTTGTPRISFQVSADTANATATPIEFGDVNATYTTAFQPFSTPRLFTALTSNVITVRFFIPGTDTPAGVRGFGAVFTDVDLAGSTRIEYFDDEGDLILSRDVLATPGDASLSFLGVKVSVDDPVAEVRVTSGAAAVGPNDVTQGGAADIVVMDDFIYGEPGPLPPPPAVQFESSSFSAAEGATASVTVTRMGDLDEPAQAAFETRDGTARGGEDYLPAGGTVSFAAGESTKTIPVTLLSDAAVEDGETLEIALTIPAAGTTIGAPATATVTIANVPVQPDITNPGISGLEVVPAAFELGTKPLALAKNPKTARILFRLSEGARVTFTFEQLVRGRLVKGKCGKETRANRTAKRCTRVKVVKGVAAVDAARGVNAVRFEGLITTSRKLAAGRYRVVGEAVDAAGNRSSKRRTPFEVLKRGAR